MKPGLVLLAASVAMAATAPAPPTLRLGDNVRPSRYSLDLTVVPNQDTFQGSAEETIEIRTATDVIWLNATALQIQDASFKSGAGDFKARIVSGGDNFAGLAFDHAVSGKGVLHLSYEGKISRNSSAGLFQLKDGDQWYVYSQFEPTDARRAFPCFDEPGFKVPWQLTLHVREDDLALSNTPVLSETAEDNGMKAVKFKQTPPLPSYLVALAVGHFDVVDAGRVGQTPVRVITPHGRGSEAEYAKSTIPQLLKLLEEYFGIPFPYEKLDSIAMPISNFAMENAGLITYGSSLLLSKPQTDTIDRQRTFASVGAHEMAHQWFGDLVTTAWWNDIWLNEAFATWMERKIVGEWKPEWNTDVTVVKSRLRVMGQDSLVTARRIRQPIESYSDIANAFDSITYQKGAAVIHMFESWVGEEKFRNGVQMYLRQHAWGNATAGDFESAIGSAAGRNIAPAFNSFLDQPGVPEVTMSLDCSGNKPALALSQKRSLPIGSSGSANEIWQVPVCIKYGVRDDMHRADPMRECSVLAGPRSQMRLAQATGCPAWVMGNSGETGYYRVDYKDDLLNQLMAESSQRLSIAERAGILGDVAALVNTGNVSPRVALALVPKFSGSQSRELTQSAMAIAATLEGNAVPEDARPNAARFIRAAFGERARKLGWQGAASDSDDTRLLRQSLVPFVASEGEDKELIQQAAGLARKWLTDRAAIEPGMVNAVLRVAAEFGAREFFDQLRAAALKEQNPRIKETLLRAMGSFHDPEIAQAAMALVLTDEFDMRQAFGALLFGPLGNPGTRGLPFQFVTRNIDALIAHLPRETGGDFAAELPFTGEGFCDAEHRQEVDAFFKDRVRQYTGGTRNLAQVLESIDLCIARKKTLGPELEAFLKNY